MDIEQIIEFERARRDCWKLLAACFYQPQKAVFLEESLYDSLNAVLTRVCPEAARFSEKMAATVRQHTDEDLLVEHARLFVGPHELLAPPYGSVYLEEGRRVMGESTARVMEFYQTEGLSLDRHFADLPDHIAAELEFMYYLAHHEVEALEKNDLDKVVYFMGRQDAFLPMFLDGWVVSFCDRIKEVTNSGYYHALADCLSVFISKTERSAAMPQGLEAGLART